MTRPRYDQHSTEFGLWLREQAELDSRQMGFIATNLDYIWSNYRTGLWMLLEEKRYNGSITRAQRGQFKKLDTFARKDDYYRGFHLIVFELTSPDDGFIKLNGRAITKDDLIEFLKFSWTEEGLFPRVRAQEFIFRECIAGQLKLL